MYVSNNSPVNVYFDDVTMTHSATSVIQYNQHYPFGLQAENSWTRTDHSNDFLYNGGSELNGNAAWYETFFRGYDPALGRFHQVDPLAVRSSSYTPYNFAFNNPALLNDPNGDYPPNTYVPMLYNWEEDITTTEGGGGGGTNPYRVGPGSGNHWSDSYRSIEGNAGIMSTRDFFWVITA